jgi:NhaP-type Na+/H+ and K+/H+ antiporter
LANVQGSATIFNAVFFVVLVSTLAQGMTLEPFARRLGLATEEKPYDRARRNGVRDPFRSSR